MNIVHYSQRKTAPPQRIRLPRKHGQVKPPNWLKTAFNIPTVTSEYLATLNWQFAGIDE